MFLVYFFVTSDDAVMWCLKIHTCDQNSYIIRKGLNKSLFPLKAWGGRRVEGWKNERWLKKIVILKKKMTGDILTELKKTQSWRVSEGKTHLERPWKTLWRFIWAWNSPKFVISVVSFSSGWLQQTRMKTGQQWWKSWQFSGHWDGRTIEWRGEKRVCCRWQT